MKVYAVFEGCYSDRSLDSVFSTKEKAQDFIDFNIKFGNGEIDDEPFEFILNECNYPEKVFLSKVLATTNEVNYRKKWERIHSEHEEGIFKEKPYFSKIIESVAYVTVRYNKNFDVMIKAANDKLAMLKAEKEGI